MTTADEPLQAEGEVREVINTVSGTKQRCFIDANGRILAECPVIKDGWRNRKTFAGDMTDAKRAAVLGDRFESDEPPRPVRPVEE